MGLLLYNFILGHIITEKLVLYTTLNAIMNIDVPWTCTQKWVCHTCIHDIQKYKILKSLYQNAMYKINSKTCVCSYSDENNV